MIKDDFYFIDNRIASENIGEHDGDNRFLLESVRNMMKSWKEEHEDCTPIGVCYDDSTKKYDCYPMVYEDQNGNRFYTHIPVDTIKEYISLENEMEE